MQLSQSHSEKSCPGFAELSSAMDQVEPEFGRWSDHCQSCSACRKILKDMQMTDAAVKNCIEFESSKAGPITAAIKREFYRKIELEQRKKCHSRSNAKLALQLAAALMICCTVIFWALRGTIYSTPPSVSQSSTSSIDLDDFPYYSNAEVDQDNLPRKTFSENTVTLHDFMPAGYGSDPVFIDHAFNQAKKKAVPADIAGVVNHVWIVKDLNTMGEELSHLESKIEGRHALDIKCGLDEVTLTGKISKLHLVKLVKLLHDSGFELISPQSPQPEETLFRGEPSTQVYYSSCFVTVDSPPNP